MSCSRCKVDKRIVNKHHNLCIECNNMRLHGSIHGKQYKFIQKEIKPLKTLKKNPSLKSLFVDFGKSGNDKMAHYIFGGRRAGKNFILDELFYEKCFNHSDHKCEECGTKLPTEFRDDEGKIIARWRYSHIIAKSIAPELRHDIKNINHLCLKHHQEWEFGDKKKMKIYEGNCKRFPTYLQLL